VSKVQRGDKLLEEKPVLPNTVEEEWQNIKTKCTDSSKRRDRI
jgi:hypothetical protein